jgi:hypothetical protein
MTAAELESKAWRLIAAAKTALTKARRRLLMQEAFDLITRACALRQLDGEAANGVVLSGVDYRLRLSNRDGNTLWILLDVESRADAIWAAHMLAEACADEYEDYDLWDGPVHVAGNEIKGLSYLADTAEEVAVASQHAVLDAEDVLMRSERAIARSQRLLAATELLRSRLVSRAAQQTE